MKLRVTDGSCPARCDPRLTTQAIARRGAFSHVLPDVLRQDLVDERLVADPSPLRLLAQLPENAGVEPNRDQLSRCIAERRAPDPAHRSQLLGRRLGDVAEINRARGAPRVPGGSPAAR